MFEVFTGLENGRNFLKIPVLVWLWVGFGKFISWSIKHRYLPFLSSRSENKTVRWTHRDNQTSPGLHASSWTSKAASVTGDPVSLPSQSAKLNSRGHFYSSLWLNPIFSQLVTGPDRFRNVSPVWLPLCHPQSQFRTPPFFIWRIVTVFEVVAQPLMSSFPNQYYLLLPELSSKNTNLIMSLPLSNTQKFSQSCRKEFTFLTWNSRCVTT